MHHFVFLFEHTRFSPSLSGLSSMTRSYRSQRIVPRTYSRDRSSALEPASRSLSLKKPCGWGGEAMPQSGFPPCNLRDTITNPANYLVAWGKRRLPQYSKVISTRSSLPVGRDCDPIRSD